MYLEDRAGRGGGGGTNFLPSRFSRMRAGFYMFKGFHLHCLCASQGGLLSFIIFIYDALFL